MINAIGISINIRTVPMYACETRTWNGKSACKSLRTKINFPTCKYHKNQREAHLRTKPIYSPPPRVPPATWNFYIPRAHQYRLFFSPCPLQNRKLAERGSAHLVRVNNSELARHSSSPRTRAYKYIRKSPRASFLPRAEPLTKRGPEGRRRECSPAE